MSLERHRQGHKRQIGGLGDRQCGGVALDVPVLPRPPRRQAFCGRLHPSTHGDNRNPIKASRSRLLEQAQVVYGPMATITAPTSMLCASRSIASPGGEGRAATAVAQ